MKLQKLLCASMLWSTVALGDAMPGCKHGERLQLNPIPEGATNHSGGICVPMAETISASFVLYGVIGVTSLLGIALVVWIRKQQTKAPQ